MGCNMQRRLCVQAWSTLFGLGEDNSGRSKIAQAMRICPDLLTSSQDVAALADWASSAWDYMVRMRKPLPLCLFASGHQCMPMLTVNAGSCRPRSLLRECRALCPGRV